MIPTVAFHVPGEAGLMALDHRAHGWLVVARAYLPEEGANLPHFDP
jgi:hypothetical protein